MSDPPPEPQRAQRPSGAGEPFTVGGGVATGILLIICGTIVLFGIMAATDEPYGMLMPLTFWGVAQLAYMLPAIAIAAVKQQRNLAKGMALASAGAFLLNATCFGIVVLAG